MLLKTDSYLVTVRTEHKYLVKADSPALATEKVEGYRKFVVAGSQDGEYFPKAVEAEWWEDREDVEVLD